MSLDEHAVVSVTIEQGEGDLVQSTKRSKLSRSQGFNGTDTGELIYEALRDHFGGVFVRDFIVGIIDAAWEDEVIKTYDPLRQAMIKEEKQA